MGKDETGSENASEDDDEEPVILTVEDIPVPNSNNQLPLLETNSEPVVKQQSTFSQDNVTIETMTLAASKPDIVPSVARQQRRGVFPQGVSYK